MRCIALHSSQSHGGQWRSFAKGLPAGFSLEAPNLIGYGANQTFTPTPDFRLSHELAAIERQGLTPSQGPVVLVGHSYGGALALHWARRFPEAVQALILYEPVAFHVLPEGHVARTEITAVADAMESMTDQQACQHFVDYWNTPGYFAALPKAAQQLMVQQQPKVSADFDALLNEPASLDAYANLPMPVHLFKGTQSPLSSRTVAQLLAEAIPKANLTRVEAGHMGPLTDARRVTPLLLNALPG
ncbi:alpha/beta hydrolase [Aliidiomarina taiwanensis]|uniref:Alpha/beta hydrolase n=1 Tax=Aliidiomarina taiwanensis TaxID=946228 RepID=A0A432X2A9_9GAMM|nr:alpha/beta hydrolase [Aliidiomarina taiwanensis]RUO40588.1 alpha/beta hydrolase [Aliidiomarina taiwanensis]